MTTKTETKKFRYGDHIVKYDMDALEKAVDGLEYEAGEGGSYAYATGLMSDGCECRVRIAQSDDGVCDSGDDCLTISAGEIHAHCDRDTPDSFVITSIGGYEAEVEEFKPSIKKLKLWVRAGITIEVTPEQLKVVMEGSDEEVANLFRESLKKGTAYLDGETYMPEDMYDGDEYTENLTKEQLDKLNGSLEWDFRPVRPK